MIGGVGGKTEPIHWRISGAGFGKTGPTRALACETLMCCFGGGDKPRRVTTGSWESYMVCVGRPCFHISARCVLPHDSVEKLMSCSAMKSQNRTQILGSKITSHPKSGFRPVRFYRGGTTEPAAKHIQTRTRQSARELSHMTA